MFYCELSYNERMSDKSILLVDDEADIREVMSSALESSDIPCKVLQGGDGADALKKISVQKFDLVITDLKMPKMDGSQLIDSIQNVDKDFRPENMMVASAFSDDIPIDENIVIIKNLSRLMILLKTSRLFLNKKRNQKRRQRKRKIKLTWNF